MGFLNFLARLPFKLLCYVCYGVYLLFRVVAHFLSIFLGRLNWQAPAWLRFLGRPSRRLWQWANSNQAKASFIMLLLALGIGGGFYLYDWYKHRPAINEITFQVTGPRRTNYRDGEADKPGTVAIRFSASAAALGLSGKQVDAMFINMQPAKSGTWKWSDDRNLLFTPQEDWQAGQAYRVTWQADKMFAPHVLISSKQPGFTTPVFTQAVDSGSFEQDQKNSASRRANFQIKFSHPVDAASLAKRVSMALEEKGEDPKPLNFKIDYDTTKLLAYITSPDLELPLKGGRVSLNLAAGVAPMVGGQPSKEALSSHVAVPGRYSLQVNTLNVILADNDRYETDQLINLEFNQAVADKDAARVISAYLLPKYKDEQAKPDQPAHNWYGKEVDEKILARATKLSISHIENAEQYSFAQNFKFKAAPGSYIFVKVEKGLEAFGGYTLGKEYFNVIRVPEFTPMLRLVGSGSLLSLSGEHRLSLMGRNIEKAYLEISRLRPEQLQHLVAFNQGSYQNPYLSFSSDHFSDRFKLSVAFDDLPTPQYRGADLTPYLAEKNGQRRLGVFLLRASSSEDLYDYAAREYAGGGEGQTGDARLLVVSDLGIILKEDIFGGKSVFVQSTHSGQAVDGAKVQMVAINGQVLQSATTKANGLAYFEKVDGYVREQEPAMYLVQKNGDVNFLPVKNDEDRFLNYSRFNVGGESTPQDAGQLIAHMFSERGLYRPGDSFHLGIIVRNYGWNKNLAGLPLTLNIIDASGNMVHEEVLSTPADGFMEFSYDIGEAASTGFWRANLYLQDEDGVSQPQLIGAANMQVQEFEPDRMQVTASLSRQKTNGWVHPKDLHGLVKVQNLFGTPAQNRRVEASYSIQPGLFNFSKYAGYTFYDKLRSNLATQADLTPMMSDENGLAVFNLNLGALNSSSYQLTFMAQAFEAEGGRGVSAAVSGMVSSSDFMVGSKADGDLTFVARQSVRKVNFIAINPDLQMVESSGLNLRLLENKYVSILTRQPSGIYKYQSQPKQVELWRKDIDIPAQGLEFTLPTEQAGRFSLILCDKDGQELNRVNFTVAGAGNLDRSLERNAELELTLDKDTYAPGEKMQIAVRAPYTGSGLITIEKDRVYSHSWFKVDTTSSVQTITVPEELEGNAYVNVQFVRDPNSAEIFMSPLSFAVAPFNISRAGRTAEVKLSVPAVVKPGQVLPITLSSNQQGRVVVFAVDEGILQVARYNLQNPLDTFFRKRALQVRTAQILDLILPEFRKFMELFAAGGDAAEEEAMELLASHLNPFKRQRDKPVVYWSGIKDIKDQLNLEFKVPEYFNGKLRFMAVEVSREKIGIGQSSCLVRDDFVLSPNMPLTVAPGDEFVLSVGVANNMDNGEAIPIKIRVAASAGLQIMEGAEQIVDLRGKSEGSVSLKVRALDIPGAALVNIKASWQDKAAERAVSVSLRPVTPFTTAITAGRMEDKQVSLGGLRQMYDNYGKREIWLGYTPSVLMQGLSGFLSNYPHQCTEQIVSRAWAGLIMAKYPEVAKLLQIKIGMEQVEQTLQQLASRQNSQGSFGAWTASPEEDPFVSTYVVQFLLGAKDQGATVPRAMLDAANRYLHSLAGNNYYNDLPGLRLRALAVYLLTRQGVVTSNYIAQMLEILQKSYKGQWENDLCAAYLASSYQLMRKQDEAEALMGGLWKRVNQASADFGWQGVFDPLSQEAIVIYLAGRHFPGLMQGVAPQSLESLTAPLAKANFNTISAAMTMLALDSYAQQALSPEVSEKLRLSQIVDGNEKVLAHSQNGLLASNFSGQADKLKLENQADLPAWFSLLQAGFDKTPPARASANGLEIIREFKDMAGNGVSQVKMGQEIIVHLKVRAVNNQHISNVAIIDLLPGGFEVVRNNNSLSTPAEAAVNWRPSHVDVREDRVVFYTTVSPGISEFRYIIKATNQGVYAVPPAYAEAMYRRDINANSAPSAPLRIVAP